MELFPLVPTSPMAQKTEAPYKLSRLFHTRMPLNPLPERGGGGEADGGVGTLHLGGGLSG